MRVFLDTNVVVSAMATRGLCADVFREAVGHHQLVVSEILLDEIKAVLRAKLGVPEKIVSDVVGLLREGSVLSKPSPSLGLPIEDPTDRALVTSALNGKADLFVTGDRELLDLAEVGPLVILSPRMFWERLKGRPE